MRFFSLLLPFVLVSDALSSSAPKRRSDFRPQVKPKSLGKAPTTPNELGLAKRQRPGAVAGVTLCAQLGAGVLLNTRGLANLVGLGQLLDLSAGEQLCICVAGGVLTDNSVAIIRPRVTNNLVAVLGLLGVLDANAAVNAIVNALVVLLGQPPYEDECGFPANSVPDGCGICTYTCADGFTRCGTQCLRMCPSNIPAAGGGGTVGRRGLHGSADLLCAKGLSACGIVAPGGGGKLLVRGKIECLDTASDVETCGGCIVPLPGRPQGIDCTALPFVMDVSCVQGRCFAKTCEEGYEAVDGVCVEVRSSVEGQGTQNLLGLDLQLAADLGLGVLKA